MKLPLLLILVLMFTFGCGSPVTKEVKPEIDFYALIGKTPEQIEQIYGKPMEAEKESISARGEEYRYYEKYLMQVSYVNGVAVTVHYQIPGEQWSTSTEETLKICGLKISTENAMFNEKSVWWQNEAAKPFASVRLERVVSGNPYRTAAYGSCEVRSV